jgi:hypothetical protein
MSLGRCPPAVCEGKYMDNYTLDTIIDNEILIDFMEINFQVRMFGGRQVIKTLGEAFFVH